MQTFLRGMLLMTLCIWVAPTSTYAQLSLIELARSAAETVLQEAAEKAPLDDAGADAVEADTTAAAEVPVETAPLPIMVERNIFTPGPQPEVSPAPLPAARPAPTVNPDREIVFTGTMIRDGQRRALLREVGGSGAIQTDRSRFYSEGDQVKGMTISEIGRNYIVLTGDETEHRMNLYLADRTRPEAPPPPPPSPGPQIPTAATTQGPSDGPPSADAGGAMDGSRPGEVMETPGPAAQRRRAQPPGTEGDPTHPGSEQTGVAPPHGAGQSNPFLEIMRRAAERREQMGGNPLLDAFGGGG